MKNSIIAVFIFLILCGFIYYADKDIMNTLSTISSTSNEIENLMNHGLYEEATLKARKLYEDIQVKTVMTSIYLNHTEADYLSDESTRLFVYLSNDEFSDATASLKLLQCNTENLIDLQKFQIKNIF